MWKKGVKDWPYCQIDPHCFKKNGHPGKNTCCKSFTAKKKPAGWVEHCAERGVFYDHRGSPQSYEKPGKSSVNHLDHCIAIARSLGITCNCLQPWQAAMIMT